MAKPSAKLAESLETLRKLQDEKGIVAIKTSEISRTHRERLIKNGYLREVAKGWYITSIPNDKAGDTTSWYTSYWSFCSRYLAEKYGKEYCISAEQSILIHSGNNTVPQQLIIRTPKAPGLKIELLHNTSLYIMKSTLPQKAEIVIKNGIRMMTLPSALITSAPIMYKKNPIEMRTALAQISDSSEILNFLLDGSHTVIAGRLAGAFRNIDQTRIAEDILKTMKSADFDIRETDPFDTKSPIQLSLRPKSPYVNRIKLMWFSMRPSVLKHFPQAPGLPENPEKYLKSVDQLYTMDAYHSLSIERYTVSVELIEMVKSGEWDLEENAEHRKQRDAMAARGYFNATQIVKTSISKILNGTNPGIIVDQDHSDWYRELFSPSVSAGILKPSDLAGYRNHQVYISNSKHVPLETDAVRDAMPTLFSLLETEDNAAVRAVLGHFIFVYIHPYMDGNGRIARFLMNTMLASGGYPWTVIPVEERDTYMNSLEEASVNNNIEPYAKFLAHLVGESIKGMPVAKLDL
jgi:fido (protein-threonine AMPylation protein)